MSNIYESEVEGPEEEVSYTKKDFMSDQMIRWCPGCGDYSILSQTQTVMSKLGIPKENFAVISGIGCSSRFPYYMETYGFHSIHGRAPAFATGAKCVNETLSTWVITGDGDSLSIGGNHFAHVLRRNVDVQVLLFNNRIYGLTKGQYSPTSEVGKKTKSSPMGSLDRPFMPLQFALGSGATFLARSVDVYAKPLRATLTAAEAHTGTSLVEIYQNCNIFNDGAFKSFADKKVRDDRTIVLEHGQPMVFGKERDKGIRLDGLKPVVADLANGAEESGLLVHDEKTTDPTLANLLARLEEADESTPVPVGVFRALDKPTYDGLLDEQVAAAREQPNAGDMAALLAGGETWTVQ